MKTFRIFVGLLVVVSLPIAAQKASTLDELLQNVEQGMTQDASDNQKRENEFRQKRGQQEALLSESTATKVKEEERSAKLENVLETIAEVYKKGKWLEITTLLIPGKNDNKQELKDLTAFIAGISKDIPWHVSRFHPDYLMQDVGITPLKKLEEAIKIGENQGLKYIYIGNVPGHEKEHTYCPSCGEPVIIRHGYMVENKLDEKGKCPHCSFKLAGIWA